MHISQVQKNSENRRFKVDIKEENLTKLLETEIKARIKYPFENLQAINSAAKWLTKGKNSLILQGVIGNGKTTIAKSILSLLRFLNIEVFEVTALDFSKLKEDDRDFLASQKILLLDDLGTERTLIKDFGNNIYPIKEILLFRYEHDLTTILTTNLTDKQISEKYGERILDRVNEKFNKIIITNKSFRK